MTSPSKAGSADKIRDILHSAVDLYVHGSPDLLDRRLDDIALATELKRDGLSAAVHRHHFSSTAERSHLVSDATGFELIGAVLLNGTAGGIKPPVVDLAIRMGARWVSLPTLSARRYQNGERGSKYSRQAVSVIGAVPVADDQGNLKDEVHEILDLVAAANVVLNLGYIDYTECISVLEAAQRHAVQKVVLTNPISIMGLSNSELNAIMEFPEVTLEFTCSSMSLGLAGKVTVTARDVADIIRRFGIERCALSSDSGHAGVPPAVDMLSEACANLALEGLLAEDLRTLVREIPLRLLGIA